ncbi:Flp pilus assembly protein CpaB [Phytoactinopolyspora halotolerans]|uniref:Flagellar biosynthesis protein FlgA n=1 Tax=Phytoactinopolyspora halotolerans TaxID=1981512 RepID=A0A6L9S6P6_9ACTN|nr:RcpC/CpaB family pilus assembly protein [Phytoactinopolyspora halotolerans]NEE01135.1 flagellar biosynthesis protein FlgA [Phytoactinopolyspora halotolerans]
MESGHLRLVQFARAIAWRRRLLAAGLAAGTVALAIEAISTSSAPPGAELHVAAHDLPGGTILASDDVTTVTVPPDAQPDGALNAEDISGRVLAGPVRAGEPITDVRVIGPSLLSGWDDELEAVPVRIADAGSAALLRPGDRINLLAVSPDGLQETRVVASAVPVLFVGGDTPADSVGGGALVTVAVTSDQAADLAHAGGTARLSFTIPDTSHR